MEKRNNNLVGVLVFFIIILIVMFGVYVAYDQGLIFNGNNDVEENNDKNEIEEKEVEITSTEEKEKLEKIITLFNQQSFNYPGVRIQLYNNLNLTNEEKLRVVLLNLYYNDTFTNVTIPQGQINISDSELVKYLVDGNSDGSGKQISADRVEKEYYDLFNEKINHQDILVCPSFYYDATNKVYYSYAACGGSGGGEGALTYIIDILKKMMKHMYI